MVTDANNMPAPFTIIDHPLIQHKLTIMRDKQTSTAGCCVKSRFCCATR